MYRFVSMLWGIYLGISPIYWLPAIAPDKLRVVKFLLIGSAVVFTWLGAMKRGEFRIPKGIFGPAGFAAIMVASVFGFYQAADGDLLKPFLDFSMAFLMFWSFSSFYTQDTKRGVEALVLGAVLLAGFCVVTVSSFLVNIPSWHPPPMYDCRNLSECGFGAKRTGWSNGVALFLPLLFLIVVQQRVRVRDYICAGVMGVAIVFSQFIVAGRGGLLASLVGAAVIVFRIFPRKVSIPFIVLMPTCALILTTMFGASGLMDNAENPNTSREEADLASHLRFDRLENGIDYDTLNHFSAGRIESMRLALGVAREHPLIGVGFGKAVWGGEEVHNLWLRLQVEAGILLPSVFLMFVLRVVLLLRREWRMAKDALHHGRQPGDMVRHQKTATILLVVLAQGIVISMFEPNALIGSFQATAVWWAALGVAVGATRTTQVRRRTPLASGRQYRLVRPNSRAPQARL